MLSDDFQSEIISRNINVLASFHFLFLFPQKFYMEGTLLLVEGQ